MIPFLGSGTTATVAKKLGRNYYGIEKEKKYFKAAIQRLGKTIPLEDNFLDTLKNNRSKPRIPFGSLVELGIIKTRNKYFLIKRKKLWLKLWLMGALNMIKPLDLSIQVAATILGAESCNGWTYWHCNINGVSVPIDNLRQRLIANN